MTKEIIGNFIKTGDKLVCTYCHNPDKKESLNRYTLTVDVIRDFGFRLVKTSPNTKECGEFISVGEHIDREPDGVSLSLYAWGSRELTETERAIWEGRPSNQKENKKAFTLDAMADGSEGHYADEYYFEKNKFDAWGKNPNKEIFNRSTQKFDVKKLRGVKAITFEIVK